MAARRDLGLCPDFPSRGAGNLQGEGQRVRVAGLGCTWPAGCWRELGTCLPRGRLGHRPGEVSPRGVSSGLPALPGLGSGPRPLRVPWDTCPPGVVPRPRGQPGHPAPARDLRALIGRARHAPGGHAPPRGPGPAPSCFSPGSAGGGGSSDRWSSSGYPVWVSGGQDGAEGGRTGAAMKDGTGRGARRGGGRAMPGSPPGWGLQRASTGQGERCLLGAARGPTTPAVTEMLIPPHTAAHPPAWSAPSEPQGVQVRLASSCPSGGPACALLPSPRAPGGGPGGTQTPSWATTQISEQRPTQDSAALDLPAAQSQANVKTNVPSAMRYPQLRPLSNCRDQGPETGGAGSPGASLPAWACVCVCVCECSVVSL